MRQEGIGSRSEGDHGVMAKKVKSRLADDLWAGLDELRDFLAGKKTGAVVHRVSPSQSDARDARRKLGLEVIKNKPKALRRANAKRNSAA
jgi:hypothetical protein